MFSRRCARLAVHGMLSKILGVRSQKPQQPSLAPRQCPALMLHQFRSPH